jgi:hypothetical protein
LRGYDISISKRGAGFVEARGKPGADEADVGGKGRRGRGGRENLYAVVRRFAVLA